MSAATRNMATLRAFYRLFYNEKRLPEGASLLREDFVNHHASSRGGGRAGMVRDFGDAVRERAPSFAIEIQRIIAADDYVWTVSRVSGLPQGRVVDVVDIWRFDGEAIAEHWDVADRAP